MRHEIIFAATRAWQKYIDPSALGAFTSERFHWWWGIYCAAVSSFAALRMRRALFYG
jgi:hypothetical protein